MLAVTYNRLATQVPAIQVPAGFADLGITGATPVFDPALALPPSSTRVMMRTQPSLWTQIVNRGLNRFDLACRLGALGGWGVETGLDLLDLDAFGLPVTAGVSMVDGVAVLPSLPPDDATVAAGNPLGIGAHVAWIDNQDNLIWQHGDGTLAAPVTGSLLPPDASSIYLGCASIKSGALTAKDYSGRMTRRLGGLWERTTADAGVPTDTPPAGLWFVQHSTGSGLDVRYLWDGTQYRPLGVFASASAADTLLDALEGQGARIAALEFDFASLLGWLVYVVGIDERLPARLAERLATAGSDVLD